MDFLKKHAFLIVAGILTFHFILSLMVSSQESMIFDEKAHIPAAYSYVRYGDMRLNPEHPPFLKDLAGLPLLFLQPAFPLASKEWQSGANEQWAIGDMFVNCTRPDIVCNDADTILFWSRIPITLIAVVLGIVLFLWTRELAGTLAGLFAVTLYAFDPNIIAHNHYVTTDIGIAAFLFFAFYFFVRFLKNPSFKNVLIAGIFLGLAELAKFSAVLLFPIFGLFAVLYGLSKRKPTDDARSVFAFKLRSVFEYVLKYAGSVIICFGLIWILYFMNTLNMPGEKLSENALAAFPHTTAVGKFAIDFVTAPSQSPLLKPFSEYFLGVFMVFGRVTGGNTYYFLGQVSNQASPWYFPIVFLLKETLPFLIILLLTSLYALSRIGKTLIREKGAAFPFLVRLDSRLDSAKWAAKLARSFQNNTTTYLALFFILFYSYVSITGNLNIGLRHLFPILPFLYMLTAKVSFDFFRRHENDKVTRQILACILGGLTLSIVAIPILAYPSYLSYFNAAAGGHLNGYQYVTDSNYDWGQDLKHLRNFVDTYNNCLSTGIGALNCKGISINPKALTESSSSRMAGDKALFIDKIRVDYFGGASPTYYLGNKYVSWHSYNDPEPGWYALSAGFIQESSYSPNLKPGDKTYAWRFDYPLVTRAGDSIFVYYIPEIK